MEVRERMKAARQRRVDEEWKEFRELYERKCSEEWQRREKKRKEEEEEEEEKKERTRKEKEERKRARQTADIVADSSEEEEEKEKKGRKEEGKADNGHSSGELGGGRGARVHLFSWVIPMD